VDQFFKPAHYPILGDRMGKLALVAGLCLILTGTTVEAVGPGVAAAGQINIPSFNPDTERRLERVRQQEARERLRRANIVDAQKILALATELKQYAHSEEMETLPADAVKKVKEVEKLAKRVNYRVRESALRVRSH
jgi:hypothetical protein